jgi:hypothetical protein
MKPKEWFIVLNVVEPIMQTDLVVSVLTPMNGVIIHLRRFINKFSFNKKQRKTFKFLLIALTTISLAIYLFITEINLSSQPKNALSFKEKDDLKLFFHDLFADNELGYTLFGDKPMSFCMPTARAPYFSKKDCAFWIYREGTLPLFRGLIAWKKVSSRLKKENYSFIICEESQYANFVILINKKAFTEQFAANIDLFQKYYGKRARIDHILNDLESKKNYSELSTTPLFHNDVLLGIMLGFGRHNAELFQRREELTEPKFSLTFISPNKGFSSTEEEVQYLWQHLQLTRNTHDWLLRVTGVGFAGDPDDQETHILVKKYDALHKELTAVFDRQDWLEVILDKLLKK